MEEEKFYSENLEVLTSLEESVALSSPVAFKFGKEFVRFKSASNGFQPIL